MIEIVVRTIGRRGSGALLAIMAALALLAPLPAHSSPEQLAALRLVVEPLLLDVLGDGVSLTAPGDGVPFDLDGDGQLETVAWTTANSDDGFLALDATRTGAIEDGRKLVGGLFAGKNGFSTLEMLDADPSLLPIPSNGPGKPSDGLLQQSDPVFNQLIVWVDRNHNGVSEPAEMRALAKLGVTRLYTGITSLVSRDVHGNVITFVSNALIRNSDDIEVKTQLRSVRLRSVRQQ